MQHNIDKYIAEAQGEWENEPDEYGSKKVNLTPKNCDDKILYSNQSYSTMNDKLAKNIKTQRIKMWWILLIVPVVIILSIIAGWLSAVR